MKGSPGRLLAGDVGKPHGIAGEVYVVRISDDPSRFEPGARLLHESGRVLTIEGSRPHRDRLLVKFAGVDDRTAAESLRGLVYVESSDLRALDEDEFWIHELAGATVVARDGTRLGEVSRVVGGPAQDLLAVRTDAGERLVPMVKEIVVEVDVGAGRVTIDPPPGLLE
jgi:16S rRNA processing protein RimM